MTLVQNHLSDVKAGIAEAGVDWSRLIVEASQEVFEIMVAAKLTPVDAAGQRRAGITAMVGFAGAPCGVFSVRCPWDTAAAIAARMLGSGSEELAPEEVCDALGEICNMVAGSMKARLQDSGAGCMMSIPTVVRGVDYEVRCLACDRCFSIVMEFDRQSVVFHLELQS
jgi:chemotaxis protein CheX